MKRALVLTGTVAGTLAVLFVLSLWNPIGKPAPLVAHAAPEIPERLALEEPSGPDPRQPVEPEQEPEPEADLVPLRIITARTFARDAERVPGIAFQVLAARTDVAFEGSPMSSAPVHPDQVPLLEGRTGDDGQALIELSESRFARDSEGRPALRVRVVEPGYQQRIGAVVFRRPQDTEGDDVPTLKVMVVPGSTARGRVVDETGAGVMADVRLREWRVYNGVRKLGGGAGTRQLVDGWFELDLREDVADGVLLADAGARGTGALGELSLALDAPPRDLEILVQGAGRLRGRVTDASGVPAAGLELLVWYSEFDDELGSFVSPEPAYSELRAQGGGRLWIALESDAEGRFDVQGVREGTYVIRARTGQGYQSGYPVLLTRQPVPADGKELALELSRPHLAVRLVSADGSEWSGAPVEVRAHTLWEERVVKWPGAPTVMAYPCTPAGGDEVVQAELLEGRVAGPAEVVYEVPDGARYLVGAMGDGFLGDLQVVEVPAGAGRVPVELLAPPPRELGSVSVRVTHAGAELDGRSLKETDFDVFLESLDTGAVLISRVEYGDPAPFVLTAPAGRYRVVVEGVPFVDTHHGVLLKERELGRTEVELDLVAGETRDLPVEVGRGGRLEVTLHGEAKREDLEAVVEEYPFLGEPGREEERAAFAARAKLYLVRPGRRPEPVYTTVEWTMTSSAGTHLEPRWPLGETNTSQVLLAGRHRLVARMPGGRTTDVEVELRPDATTSVDLRF